jgi:hypothetical protein
MEPQAGRLCEGTSFCERRAMTRRNSIPGLVKFPTRRVVDRARLPGILLGSAPEAKDLDQARRSVQRAIEALRRQEQSLSVRWRLANNKATPEQIAQHQAEVMLRIVEYRQAVERDCDEYEPPQAG